MYKGYWKPSKAAAKAFAEQMDNIVVFCNENGIIYSSTMDSYYFTVNGQQYRVSNHSVESSTKYHNGRKPDVIYIHASKTRIIDIYTALQHGKHLDGHGYIITD